MDKLPPQLKWARWVKVLEKLDYISDKNSPGSARTFVSKTREPAVVTFHEPHGSSPIRPGTLREYLRKVALTRDRFFELLEKDTESLIDEVEGEEEHFRRYVDNAGIITSLCNKCFATVIQSAHEHEVDSAESLHPCYLPETS